MKKLFLIASVALFAIAFVSCKKDGEYKPKEKIVQVQKEWIATTVTTTSTGTTTNTINRDPFVTEVWTWGEKTLTSIVYKDDDGDTDNTLVFGYDKKNRIITATSGAEIAEYVYNDDKKLQTIKMTDAGVLEATYEMSYQDDLLSKITVTIYDAKKSAIASKVLPEIIYDRIESLTKTVGTRAGSTYVTNMTIEWDGKNISQIVSSMVVGEYSVNATTTFEYDGKTNPFYGMYALYGDFACFSKNNIVKTSTTTVSSVGTISNTATETESVTYEYNGKYPIKKSNTKINEDTNILGQPYKETIVTTLTYVYAE